MTKTCRACKESLSLDHFYRHPKSKFGVDTICKRCHAARQKARRHKEPSSRPCDFCGAAYTPTMTRQRTCQRKCYMALKRQNPEYKERQRAMRQQWYRKKVESGWKPPKPERRNRQRDYELEKLRRQDPAHRERRRLRDAQWRANNKDRVRAQRAAHRDRINQRKRDNRWKDYARKLRKRLGRDLPQEVLEMLRLAHAARRKIRESAVAIDPPRRSRKAKRKTMAHLTADMFGRDLDFDSPSFFADVRAALAAIKGRP